MLCRSRRGWAPGDDPYSAPRMLTWISSGASVCSSHRLIRPKSLLRTISRAPMTATATPAMTVMKINVSILPADRTRVKTCNM